MTAARKTREDPVDARARKINAAIAELTLKAMPYGSRAAIQESVSKWLSRVAPPRDAADAERLHQEAATLAVELALHAPSMSGQTPLDRLARDLKAASGDQAAALASLRKAKFTLINIIGPVRYAVYMAKDLASGKTFMLYEERLAPAAIGLDLGARIAAIGDGLCIFAGPTLLVDANSETCRPFIRPGFGLTNDQRCAAQVYRDYFRARSALRLDIHLAVEPEKVVQSFPDEELDAFVRAWAEHGEGAAPTGDALGEVRNFACDKRLLSAVISSVEMRAAGLARLAQVYREVAAIQIETMRRGEQAGIRPRNDIDRVLGILQSRAVESRVARASLELFLELRARFGQTTQRTTATGEDLQRVIDRIRALRAKTTAQGCTEQEALAAAAKVAELLERYGLSLSEIDIRKQACEGFGVDTGRKKPAPQDRCVPTIAHFCDCKAWEEKTPEGAIRFVFFGLPADVEAARYLYDLVGVAFDSETASFKNGELISKFDAAQRRGAVNSFQIGLANGIDTKLDKLKSDRQAAMRKTSGRDLEPIKTSVIDDELDKLGMRFEHKVRRRRRVVVDAFEAGRAAGRKFEIHPGLE